ncbi:MAG: Crp/Fnr family transcriptional regulator [Clostridia bacterium]|jgi:CRP/FNR family transcriptional regulator, anaerobic regulatory protein|nr:Crp/Fnr family transcriptional regulator [Clostridia bacterium]MBT7122437.1 Crp/Fnr family transcriptional regulator [Clostridia bacterium]
MGYDIFDVFGFLSELDGADKQTLKEHSVIKKMSKGQLMLGDNSRCAGIPFVLSGSIRLFRTSEGGKDITIYKVEAGELCVLAAVCSFANLEYDFTAEASEDSVLSVLSVESFNHLIKQSLVFREFVFSSIADKLIMALNAIEFLNFDSIESRLKNYLGTAADEKNVVAATHEAIAKDIGSSREVVSRKLKELENQGVLELQRGKIKINEVL